MNFKVLNENYCFKQSLCYPIVIFYYQSSLTVWTPPSFCLCKSYHTFRFTDCQNNLSLLWFPFAALWLAENSCATWFNRRKRYHCLLPIRCRSKTRREQFSPATSRLLLNVLHSEGSFWQILHHGITYIGYLGVQIEVDVSYEAKLYMHIPFCLMKYLDIWVRSLIVFKNMIFFLG